jgi:hypothetical protein
MSNAIEMLESARNENLAVDTVLDGLQTANPAERLRFAIVVTSILDGKGTGDFCKILATDAAREEDAMIDAFRGLSKRDQAKALARCLDLIKLDKTTNKPRPMPNGNGETSITDTILGVIANSKVPLTRLTILRMVQTIIPDVNEDTVRAVISNKKKDGTLVHHEETHSYTYAANA